jgi:hypothetical protein
MGGDSSGTKAWARDGDGDAIREVHGNTVKGVEIEQERT